MREFPKYATCSRTDGGGLFWPSVQPGQLGRVGLKSSLVNYWWRIVKKHRAFVEAWGICTWKRMLLATLLQCQLRTLQPATDACCAPPHTLYLLHLSLLTTLSSAFHHSLISQIEATQFPPQQTVDHTVPRPAGVCILRNPVQ